MSKPSTNFNLLVIVMSDLSRHLFLLALFFCVIASALAVIISSHENRQLVITQEQLVKQKDALDIEWRHLIIEQSALTEHNRIERAMSEKLGMKRPTREDEVLLRVK
ncbi:cell division protein FtsL [Glaciecola punicea]|jgi:cell division protein FtsL|uniref:cell division protein FtsL n=1 Tax=Glaciecola punicea TaxID=56804 RepID=UPI0005910E64|nr:cell division protein FtsL [Glaciecola punicea]OFA32420.1 cell division protein FtsL [Glaciecola punicea]